MSKGTGGAGGVCTVPEKRRSDSIVGAISVEHAQVCMAAAAAATAIARQHWRIVSPAVHGAEPRRVVRPVTYVSQQ